MNLRSDTSKVNGHATATSGSDLRDELRELRHEMERLREAITDPDAPRLLDAEEVAEYLNLSVRSVRSLIAGEKLESVKVKRRRLVPVEALNTFVEDRLNSGGGDQ